MTTARAAAVKDRLLLLLTAGVAAAASWAFFHFLGEYALAVLWCMALPGLLLGGKWKRGKARQ